MKSLKLNQNLNPISAFFFFLSIFSIYFSLSLFFPSSFYITLVFVSSTSTYCDAANTLILCGRCDVVLFYCYCYLFNKRGRRADAFFCFAFLCFYFPAYLPALLGFVLYPTVECTDKVRRMLDVDDG